MNRALRELKSALIVAEELMQLAIADAERDKDCDLSAGRKIAYGVMVDVLRKAVVLAEKGEENV